MLSQQADTEEKLEDVTSTAQLNEYERKLLTVATMRYGSLKEVLKECEIKHKPVLTDARDGKRESSHGTLVKVRKYLHNNHKTLQDLRAQL